MRDILLLQQIGAVVKLAEVVVPRSPNVLAILPMCYISICVLNWIRNTYIYIYIYIYNIYIYICACIALHALGTVKNATKQSIKQLNSN